MTAGDRDTTRSLVGRTEALAALGQAIDAANDGHSRVVLVDGSAGMGKTTLVAAALERHHVDTTLWVSGDQSETGVDLGIIDQLLRFAPRAANVGADSTSGVSAVQAGATVVRLIDGLVETGGSLTVVVDDAHWADPLSLRALTFAARRVRRDPVVLILTARSELVDRLPESLLRLVDDHGRRVRADPLTSDQVAAVVEDMAGTRVTSAQAERLHRHTGGSPLHLVTLLREISVDDLVSADELPVPDSYRLLALAQLERQGNGVRALIEAVAVLGGSCALNDVAAVADLDDPAAIVDAAAAADLIVRTAPTATAPTMVDIEHPLLRAAVLSDMRAQRRAELHRAAGRVLTGAQGLLHRIHGAVERNADLWHEAAAAARHEASLGAYGTAATLLTAADRVAADDHARATGILEAVGNLMLGGQVSEAAAYTERVRALPPSSHRSLVLAELAYTAGPRGDALSHVEEAWRLLGDEAGGAENVGRLRGSERAVAAQVASLAAFCGGDRGQLDDVVAWSRTALELDPEIAGRASVAQSLASGHALLADLDRGLAELDALCERVESMDPQCRADARFGRGMLRLWRHDLSDAERDFDTGLREAENASSFVARETARAYLAEILYRQGRWDGAVAAAHRAVWVIEDSAQEWMAALPHATLARPLAARGDAAALEHLDRAFSAASITGSLVDAGFAAMSAVEVGACRREPDRVLQSGALLATAEIAHEQFGSWRASYVEALVAAGRLDEAAAILSALDVQLRTPVQATDAARAGVSLFTARGDAAATDAWADAGLAVDPASAGPYARARLELVCGVSWRRRGERRRAEDVLRRAHRRFSDLGAIPWLEQTDREIAALGLRLAGRSKTNGHHLTPQEQAVAQLVARGLKNREVATELMVSAKTVEHHLSRIYAKVGVRSRTELTHRLLSAGGPAA